MPAPNTWGAGKHFPSTVSEGFLRLAQSKTSCGSGFVLGGVAASRNPYGQGDFSPSGAAALLPPLSQCQILR